MVAGMLTKIFLSQPLKNKDLKFYLNVKSGTTESCPSKGLRTDLSVMHGLLASPRTSVTALGRSPVLLQAAPCVFIASTGDTLHGTPLM